MRVSSRRLGVLAEDDNADSSGIGAGEKSGTYILGRRRELLFF